MTLGDIQFCDLVGVGAALLEEVCPCEGELCGSMVKLHLV